MRAASQTASNKDMVDDKLDEEIHTIREQIQELTQRRKLLSSTLLSSSRTQDHLNAISIAKGLPEDIDPLVTSSHQHAETNAYRLAFGVTAFPFRDPNPETSNVRLIGIRIDICQRDGIFGKPHYILCKRPSDARNDLRVHRHTIPAFIPLKQYENEYLPLPDEGYGSETSNDGTINTKQDLQTFAEKVRHDLISWTRRREAIELLNAQLDIPDEATGDNEQFDADNTGEDSAQREGKYGIVSLSATAIESRFARIEWSDGRVGRIKISDDGIIERAVVFGEEGRLKTAERILCDGRTSILNFARTLEALDLEDEDMAEG